MIGAEPFCTFTLGGSDFGIEVRHVQEVVPAQEMTRVPLAPAAVRGLMNLRGQIVTVVDLRRRLGLPDSPHAGHAMNLVLRRDDGALSLLVDAVGDVIEVNDKDFEGPPATVQGATRGLIRGAFKLADRLLLVLDPERVLELAP